MIADKRVLSNDRSFEMHRFGNVLVIEIGIVHRFRLISLKLVGPIAVEQAFHIQI